MVANVAIVEASELPEAVSPPDGGGVVLHL